MSYTTFPLNSQIKSITRIPMFRTGIINYGNKVEQRYAKDSLPRHKFQIEFIAKISDANIDVLLAFFYARKGSFEAFYLQSIDEITRSLTWQPGTAYAAGSIVRPTVRNGHSYLCAIGGTSHAANQPTWPTTENQTVVDNTVTWKENSYLVRFEQDLINVEYLHYLVATLGQLTLIEVSA